MKWVVTSISNSTRCVLDESISGPANGMWTKLAWASEHITSSEASEVFLDSSNDLRSAAQIISTGPFCVEPQVWQATGQFHSNQQVVMRDPFYLFDISAAAKFFAWHLENFGIWTEIFVFFAFFFFFFLSFRQFGACMTTWRFDGGLSDVWPRPQFMIDRGVRDVWLLIWPK
jgi:hypothetical protein